MDLLDTVTTKDMLTPPVRSGHLDIKDAQCAETKDVLKKSHHIIAFLSYGRLKGPKRCVKN